MLRNVLPRLVLTLELPWRVVPSDISGAPDFSCGFLPVFGWFLGCKQKQLQSSIRFEMSVPLKMVQLKFSKGFSGSSMDPDVRKFRVF